MPVTDDKGLCLAVPMFLPNAVGWRPAARRLWGLTRSPSCTFLLWFGKYAPRTAGNTLAVECSSSEDHEQACRAGEKNPRSQQRDCAPQSCAMHVRGAVAALRAAQQQQRQQGPAEQPETTIETLRHPSSAAAQLLAALVRHRRRTHKPTSSLARPATCS